MDIKYIFILLLAIFFVFFILSFSIKIETWQDYTLKPYNYILSGKDPLYFFRYDRFRRPYRDGFKFYQSYPVPHMSSFP